MAPHLYVPLDGRPLTLTARDEQLPPEGKQFMLQQPHLDKLVGSRVFHAFTESASFEDAETIHLKGHPSGQTVMQKPTLDTLTDEQHQAILANAPDQAEVERLLAEAEQTRLAADKAEQDRLAEEAEKTRLANEAEQKRLADEQEAEQKRLTDLANQQGQPGQQGGSENGQGSQPQQTTENAPKAIDAPKPTAGKGGRPAAPKVEAPKAIDAPQG